MNQLLWYYADMEKQRCVFSTNPAPTINGGNKTTTTDPDACLVWRRFAK